MTHRVCRKRSTTTFKINDQYCKLFLTPEFCFTGNHWVWRVAYAISKSKRQLNDWYQNKKNKRASNMRSHLTGKGGFKSINQGFKHLLVARWQLEPGDCLYLDCTSRHPDKQFKAWSRWLAYHPDWSVDWEALKFWWHRPPYAAEPLYELGKITGVVPADPLAPAVGEKYFECFLFHPFPGVLEDMLQSTAETNYQSDQAQQHYKVDNNQNEENQESQHHQLEADGQT
jgi:hypothetical protein